MIDPEPYIRRAVWAAFILAVVLVWFIICIWTFGLFDGP